MHKVHNKWAAQAHHFCVTTWHLSTPSPQFLSSRTLSTKKKTLLFCLCNNTNERKNLPSRNLFIRFSPRLILPCFSSSTQQNRSVSPSAPKRCTVSKRKVWPTLVLSPLSNKYPVVLAASLYGTRPLCSTGCKKNHLPIFASYFHISAKLQIPAQGAYYAIFVVGVPLGLQQTLTG